MFHHPRVVCLLPRAAGPVAMLCLLLAAVLPASAADELQPGEILNESNWQKAEKLLPPEVLEHYKKGEYANPIVAWGPDTYVWPKDFLEQSKANEGKYNIGERGDIIEKATGKQPDFILGFPFPTIDPKAPGAAAMVLWNHYYRTWYFGDFQVATQMNLINAKALERRMDVVVNYAYYDAIPVHERKPNPLNLSAQQLTVIKSPADLNGTAALSWRYRDPTKRDNSWAYVPALRRVRAVSPANRSDGFAGSDMSQDDGPFFDGKVEDFVWTMKGEAEMYRFCDPISLAHKTMPAVWRPEGGWHIDWPALKNFGYSDPEWKGLAWAPISFGLVKRPLWIIEGVPRDRYYLFGRIELYIDKDTAQGGWNRKFSWNGELLNSFQVSGSVPAEAKRPDGGSDWNQAAAMGFQGEENIKRRQATVAGAKSDPKSGFEFHITFPPGFFDTAALSRFGK
jgi:hypothetical protein